MRLKKQRALKESYNYIVFQSFLEIGVNKTNKRFLNNLPNWTKIQVATTSKSGASKQETAYTEFTKRFTMRKKKEKLGEVSLYFNNRKPVALGIHTQANSDLQCPQIKLKNPNK